jgi:hypothetical protein
MNRAARRQEQRAARRRKAPPQHHQRRRATAGRSVARPVAVNAAWLAAVRARIEQSDALGRLARGHGLSPDAYLTRVDAHLHRILAAADIFIGVGGPQLALALIEGRLRNIHEKRRVVSADYLEPDEAAIVAEQHRLQGLVRPFRRSLEARLYDIPPDAPAGRFPIYGYLSADTDGGPGFGRFGGNAIRLRPEVTARAHFVFGDSLGEIHREDIDDGHGTTAPAPITAPSFVATRLAAGEDPLAVASVDDVAPWCEAQIFGPVTLADMRELLLACEPPAETAATLSRLGIAWRVVPLTAPYRRW